MSRPLSHSCLVLAVADAAVMTTGGGGVIVAVFAIVAAFPVAYVTAGVLVVHCHAASFRLYRLGTGGISSNNYVAQNR